MLPVATRGETISRLRGVDTILQGTSLPRVPAEQTERTIRANVLAALGITRPTRFPEKQ
jgi:hypothetical protein